MLNSALNMNYVFLVSFFSWLSGKGTDLAFVSFNQQAVAIKNYTHSMLIYLFGNTFK
jgi:hypothetical protein